VRLVRRWYFQRGHQLQISEARPQRPPALSAVFLQDLCCAWPAAALTNWPIGWQAGSRTGCLSGWPTGQPPGCSPGWMAGSQAGW